MDELFEKTISKKTIYNGRIFSVNIDEVELPGNRHVNREVVQHLGGVVIAAEVDNKILMVKQYRYPIKDILYELPAGKLDIDGEDVLSAAKRELEEETGYKAKNWQSLGYILTSPGFCDEKLYLFKASDLFYIGQNLDDDEFIDCVMVDKNKVFDMIKLGIINDAKSIAALMRAYKL